MQSKDNTCPVCGSKNYEPALGLCTNGCHLKLGSGQQEDKPTKYKELLDDRVMPVSPAMYDQLKRESLTIEQRQDLEGMRAEAHSRYLKEQKIKEILATEYDRGYATGFNDGVYKGFDKGLKRGQDESGE